MNDTQNVDEVTKKMKEEQLDMKRIFMQKMNMPDDTVEATTAVKVGSKRKFK